MTDKKEMPIGLGEKIGYGLGDMACNIVFASVYMYLTIFYTDVFGLSAGVVGIIFFISRFVDAITDPLMGTIVDKNQFKDGKFRPWIKWGIFPFIMGIYMVFSTPDLPEVGKIIYAFVTYNFLMIVYTMVNIPYGSLTSAMARDTGELASITSIRMFFANLTGVLVAFFVPTLNNYFAARYTPAQSFQYTAVILAALGGIMLFITYVSTRERIVLPKNAEKVAFADILTLFKTNRPFVVMCVLFLCHFGIMTIVGGASAYYVKYNMGREDLTRWFMLLGNLPALAIMPFIPWMVVKFGKKPLLYMSTVLYMVTILSIYYIPASNVPLIFIIRLLAAAASCIASGYIWALIPELIVYGEYTSGKRFSGQIYAMIGFFFKMGMAMGGIFLGFFLEYFKYVPDAAQQPPEALHGILLLMSVVPAIILVVAVYMIKLYELDEKRYAEVLEVVVERERQLNEKA
ncbi:MAG: MFS transporter [Synergistaceae bacterium]|nr:MFS transporter [Synergistaceae bacterium]